MNKTAIIVDDVAFARQVIKKILSEAKINVVGEAADGAEAVTLYNKFKPDIVTMDVVMPNKGGIEATRHILDLHKEAKVIMISAMGHEQLLMDAINAGARDYLLKPFSPEDLLRSIEKALIEEDDK